MTLATAYATVIFTLIGLFGGTIVITGIIVWFIVDRSSKKDDEQFEQRMEAMMNVGNK